MNILYDAITWLGVVFLVLQIYFFVLYLSKNKLIATAIAIFTVGGYSLVKLYHNPVSLYRPDFNMFVRPIVPLYGLTGLFLYFNVLMRWLRSWKWQGFVWPSFAMGALFYVYPFTWSFALAVNGSLFLIYVALRNVKNTKKILIITVFGISIGFYSIMRTINFPLTDAGRQILYFSVESNNHSPTRISKLSLVCLVLLAFVAFQNKKQHKSNEHLPILFSIVSASFIALNQQVVTGEAPQVMHYFWYFTIPTSIVVAGSSLWWLTDGFKNNFVWKVRRILLVIVIIIALVNTVLQQYRGTIAVFGLKQYAQNYRPIFDALNRDSRPGVILNSDGFYGTFLTVNTSHDLFWSNAVFVFNTPMQRVENALYVYMYLDKNTRNNFVEQLYKIDNEAKKGQYEENRQYPLMYQYLSAYRSGFNFQTYGSGIISHDPVVLEKRDGVILSLSKEYAKIGNPEGIISILKKSDVNYIVWDQNKNSEWDLKFLSRFLQEIVNSNNVHLYKVQW